MNNLVGVISHMCKVSYVCLYRSRYSGGDSPGSVLLEYSGVNLKRVREAGQGRGRGKARMWFQMTGISPFL